MHPNELLARNEIELIQAGDWDAVDRLYTDDIVIHYPGRNPLAGSHSAEQFLAKFQTLLKGGTSNGSFTMLLAPTITPYSSYASRLRWGTFALMERRCGDARARRQVLRSLASRG